MLNRCQNIITIDNVAKLWRSYRLALGIFGCDQKEGLVPSPVVRYVVRYVRFPSLVQSRLSVNSVTAGDYSRPLHISTFINELDSGFRLLNLKNDSLRKRYDGLKYDVKKVEEVVYDLSIRGFNKETAAACAEK